MKQEYKVFTVYTKAKLKSDYFQECVQKEIVNLVVIEKRKYAMVEWDLITLDNVKQMRKSSHDCSLENDIRNLYEAYIKKVNFKKKDLNYSIQNAVGFIYIYKEHIQEVADGIAKLIDNMIQSNCITFATPQEMHKNIPENLQKYIGNKNLGL